MQFSAPNAPKRAKKSPENLQRMDVDDFHEKNKQIGVVKHGENKHRKYDEWDEAEASRTKQGKPKALHCNLFIIISFESGGC